MALTNPKWVVPRETGGAYQAPNTTFSFGGHTHYLIPPMGGFLPAAQRAQMIGNKFYSSMAV